MSNPSPDKYKGDHEKVKKQLPNFMIHKTHFPRFEQKKHFVTPASNAYKMREAAQDKHTLP